MARRFSRVKQGQKLADAWTNYKNYWDNYASRPSRVGQGTPLTLDAICYVTPFTIDVPLSTKASARAYNDGYTTLQNYINTGSDSQASVSDALGGDTVYNISNFRPARVIWQRATTRSISTPTSQFTGQEYLKYNNLERFSCPFGGTADADDLMDAFLAIKATILAVPGYEVSRVSLQREHVGV